MNNYSFFCSKIMIGGIMENLFQKLNQFINEYDSFIIMGHKDPDLDSLGSSLGLCEIIESFGKKAYVFLNDKHLEMYNNNYGSSVTRESFPWDEYDGVGTFEDGDSSQYYKYLVDEKKGTYKLVKSFDVDYSSIVSSVQDVKDKHVTSSGRSNCYAEYDEDGVLIKKFNYTSKKYAYRVFKYDFDKIWFD